MILLASGAAATGQEISPITVPHLVKQAQLEIAAACVSLPELQVNDFPNIQIDIRLEGDAGFADVQAHAILRNLAHGTLADDAQRDADLYAVFPAPLVGKQSGFGRRGVWINCDVHTRPIGNSPEAVSSLEQENRRGRGSGILAITKVTTG